MKQLAERLDKELRNYRMGSFLEEAFGNYVKVLDPAATFV